jgi:hypothetical protein
MLLVDEALGCRPQDTLKRLFLILMRATSGRPTIRLPVVVGLYPPHLSLVQPTDNCRKILRFRSDARIIVKPMPAQECSRQA